MKYFCSLPVLVLVCGMITHAVAAEEPLPPEKLVYAAATYDSEADPDEDLAKAMTLAAPEGRHILLLVGGDWCPWCRKLAKLIEDSAPVSKVLAASYVVMKVNVSDETSNSGFLNPYPVMPEYPHLFVLDEKGKLLHSQSARELQRLSSYQEGPLAALLQKYGPEK